MLNITLSAAGGRQSGMRLFGMRTFWQRIAWRKDCKTTIWNRECLCFSHKTHRRVSRPAGQERWPLQTKTLHPLDCSLSHALKRMLQVSDVDNRELQRWSWLIPEVLGAECDCTELRRWVRDSNSRRKKTDRSANKWPGKWDFEISAGSGYV